MDLVSELNLMMMMMTNMVRMHSNTIQIKYTVYHIISTTGGGSYWAGQGWPRLAHFLAAAGRSYLWPACPLL